MKSKLPAAILTLLLYAQLGFGVAAVAAVVYNRSLDRHTVISAEQQIESRMADAATRGDRLTALR